MKITVKEKKKKETKEFLERIDITTNQRQLLGELKFHSLFVPFY